MSETGDDPTGSELVVSVRGERHVVRPGETFTFGRAASCTICLDTLDKSISRIAGAMLFEHTTWWIVNRSETRTLSIVDSIGLSSPLPVAKSGWPASRRAVDPGGVSVIVTGSMRTHELRCEVAMPLAAPTAFDAPSWSSTATQTPTITDARKEVLVALVSGYLLPYPRHDPRPLTYGEIAEMVGLPRSTVTKRVEAVRTQLRDHGVPGLDEDDARRALAEWLLSMRLIVASDLVWLEGRRAVSRAGTAD